MRELYCSAAGQFHKNEVTFLKKLKNCLPAAKHHARATSCQNYVNRKRIKYRFVYVRFQLLAILKAVFAISILNRSGVFKLNVVLNLEVRPL